WSVIATTWICGGLFKKVWKGDCVNSKLLCNANPVRYIYRLRTSSRCFTSCEWKRVLCLAFIKPA
ncbi:MAG: hypothetical protein WCQ95_13800, partial [Bacteroidota bacterium]